MIFSLVIVVCVCVCVAGGEGGGGVFGEDYVLEFRGETYLEIW